MTKKSKNKTLLASLQNLYSKIAMVFLQIRIASYHKVVETNQSFDITDVLDKQVDDLAARAVKVENHSRTVLDNEHQQDSSQHNSEEIKIESEEKPVSTESEFAKHLKHRNTSSVNQPYLGEKLTASTWEHIHSAVRYARQGDADTAKLHTEIAGQALEEAGHYLNDKEYSELVLQIEHYFMDSQKS